MVASYNGWKASPNPADFGGISPLIVAGENFSPGVRNGDIHDIFQYLAEQLHARVEPIVRPDWHQADDWGYYWKQSANSASLLSCHSSGTAIDFNATRHPNGKRGTFTPAQVAEIRRILAELDGVVYWGGDAWGNGTPDEMHFEIKTGTTVAQVQAVGAKVRARRAAKAAVPAPRPGLSGEIATTHARLNRAVKDALGAVQTPELITPDKRGRFNHFERGSIYWTPEHGAWVVMGAIRDAWERSGWEAGPLGYPVSDEFSYTGRLRDGTPVTVLQSNFEKGAITFVNGKVTVLA